MAKDMCGDTKEMIDKCLHCEEYKCTNCYDNRNTYKAKGAYRKLSERDFTEMYMSGYSDAEIARETGVETSTVWAYRKRRGLAPNRKRGRQCRTN